MGRRVAFVCNVSQRWKKRFYDSIPRIQSFGSYAKEIFVVDRSEPDSMEKHLDQIVRKPFDAVVVAGGDGSLNRAVNFLQRKRCLKRFALGVLPFGTCNDFARFLGLKKGGVSLGLECVERAETRTIKIVRVNHRYFLNNCGFGRIEPAHKKRTAWGDIRGMKPVHARLYGDNKVQEGDFMMMVCANAPYFSGGLHFWKGSDPADSLLDFFFVRKMNKLKLMTKLLLAKGGRPLQSSLQDSSILKISDSGLVLKTSAPIWMMLDGELYPDLAAIQEATIAIAGECRFLAPR